MIDESSHASDVADELDLTSSAYAEDVTGEIDLTSSAFAEDVADAINDGAGRDYTLRVMQFNIGHFNMGTQPAPTNNNPSTTTVQINSSKSDGWAANPKTMDRNYAVQLQRWQDFISEADADIIGIEEYNNYFGYNNGNAVTIENAGIFNGYNLSVGRMGISLFNGYQAVSGWQWNALASRKVMSAAGDQELGSTGINIAKCYARYATITVKGKSVIIASTHLNWAQNADAVTSRTAEIQSLISWLSSYPYVILMGDFNTDGIYKASGEKTPEERLAGADDFDPFITAGFTLANHGAWGDIKTAPATDARQDTGHLVPRSYLDNIIVKGFTMDNLQLLDLAANGPNTVDVGSITDHCVLVCDLTMIEEGGEQ